jgi:hypothetical protein
MRETVAAKAAAKAQVTKHKTQTSFLIVRQFSNLSLSFQGLKKAAAVHSGRGGNKTLETGPHKR